MISFKLLVERSSWAATLTEEEILFICVIGGEKLDSWEPCVQTVCFSLCLSQRQTIYSVPSGRGTDNHQNKTQFKTLQAIYPSLLGILAKIKCSTSYISSWWKTHTHNSAAWGVFKTLSNSALLIHWCKSLYFGCLLFGNHVCDKCLSSQIIFLQSNTSFGVYPEQSICLLKKGLNGSTERIPLQMVQNNLLKQIPPKNIYVYMADKHMKICHHY